VIEIERFNGYEELEQLLKKFVSRPTNTEIVEATGYPKSTVSEFINGKRPPSKKFITAFKKAFKIDDATPTPPQIEKPPSSTDSGLKDKMILILEKSLYWAELELQRVKQENEQLNQRLKNK
jgi:transcriptional regulator with XRE-family HTH domain